jgi:hypothetical protein
MSSIAMPDRRQQVSALGSVLKWKSGALSIGAGAYGEFDARNRPEGITVVVKVLHAF